MKLAILGVAAFLVGIGGSVGVAVMKAPPPQAASDSTAAADSTKHEAPLATSPVGAGGETGTHADTTATPSVDGAHTPGYAPSMPDSATLVTAGFANDVALDTPEQRANRAQLYKRVARILVAMKPKDAAAILARLTDDQVEGIIRTLGVRQAAAMMAEIPAERAAEMSRRIIEAPGEETP